jgi:hypothetical protein
LLGQTEAALVPLDFIPICPMGPVGEVTDALLLLDSAGAKMLQLEGVVGGWLEAEGFILVEVVVEHVLLCFHSRDHQVSMEPVVQGPDTKTEEAAWADIQDTAKLMAVRFERQAEYA